MSASEEEYVPPDRANVMTLGADRVGVTNGLLLKFPQIHAVGDISLVERPRIAIVEASDTSGSLQQAAESVEVGHPVFIAAAVLDNPKLNWPKRFIGDDKPFGRILRTSADVIDFARAT